jgi:hypothetical protein
MNKNIYIHYGSNTFYENLFIQIKNRVHFKPYGGLWASNINAKFSWKDWCESEDFFKNNFNKFFKFTLKKDSKILTIANCSQLNDIPIQNNDFFVKYTTSKFPFRYIDFEKLKESYDAIEILISNDRKLYYEIYGWDCDSILIMNKNIIELI